MNKRKKQNTNLSTGTTMQPDVLATFLKAKNEFNKAYKKSGRDSVLIARYYFEQKIDNGYDLSKANEILNNPRKMKKFLDEFHQIYLQSEQGKVEQLLKNTSFKSAMIAGVTSGTGIMLLSPFFNPLVQPLVDEIFKPVSKKVEKPAASPPSGLTPTPVQATKPTPASNITTINNYYFGRGEEELTPKASVQKGQKAKKKQNSHQPK